MSKPIGEVTSSLKIPPWMVSIEEDKRGKRAALGALGIGLVGLAARTAVTFSQYQESSSIIERLTYAITQNTLGALQQLGVVSTNPETQVVEMIAGIAITTGLTLGGGRLIDFLNNRRKLKELIEKTKKDIIEAGNITEQIPIVDHSIIVSPQGLPFMNSLAPLFHDAVLVTDSYNPYDANNKIHGEAQFPLYIKTNSFHDENVYDNANAQAAESIIIIPQSKDGFIFFPGSEKSTHKALLAVSSAQKSLPEGTRVPSLVFLQSPDEKISSHAITPSQYLAEKNLTNDVQVEYLESLVVEKAISKIGKKPNTVFLSTDLDGNALGKLVTSFQRQGYKVVFDKSEAEAIVVYFQDDAINLSETEIEALHSQGKKPVVSIIDTDIEMEEVKKVGGIAVSIEDIIKGKIEQFNLAHKKEHISNPVQVSKLERIGALINRGIAINILKRNPEETKKILKLLDRYVNLYIEPGYQFTKKRHYVRESNVTGIGLFPDGFRTSGKLWDAYRKGRLKRQSAAEIATEYFNVNQPTEEQIFSIQSILDAGDRLGLIHSMKQVQNADGIWRTSYAGITEKRIDEGYIMLGIDNQE